MHGDADYEDGVAGAQGMGKGGVRVEGKARRIAGAGARVASVGADEWSRRVEGVESGVGSRKLQEVRKGGNEYVYEYKSQTKMALGGAIREYNSTVGLKPLARADHRHDGHLLPVDLRSKQEISGPGAPGGRGWRLSYGRDAEAAATAYGGGSKRPHDSREESQEAGAPGFSRAWKDSQQAFNFTGSKGSHRSSRDYRGAAARRAEEDDQAASVQVAYQARRRPVDLREVNAIATHGFAAQKNQEHLKRWAEGKGAAKS